MEWESEKGTAAWFVLSEIVSGKSLVQREDLWTSGQMHEQKEEEAEEDGLLKCRSALTYWWTA